MKREDIRQTYLDLRSENGLILRRQKKKLLVIALLRLVVFIAGITGAVFLYRFSVAGSWLTLASALALFLYLIKHYEYLSRKIVFTENLIRINTLEMNALDGDYNAFRGGKEWIDTMHDFSNDIDLFGDDSLYRSVNRTVTDTGSKLLAQWLSDPYKLRGYINDRQQAVKELSEKLSWRQEFMAKAPAEQVAGEDINSLTEWLNDRETYFSSPFYRMLTYILPPVAIIVSVLVAAGIFPPSAFMVIFIFNLSLTGLFLKKSNRIHSMVSKKHTFLFSFEQLIKSIESEPFRSPLLTAIRNRICAGENSVAGRIKSLSRIIRLFDSRLNMLAGFFLNGLVLWDFMCIRRLEEWKRSTASGLPLWMNLIGEIDALNSLANYAFNNPDSTYPEIAGDTMVFEASGIGHPLIDRAIRVDNDFSVDRKGQVFIITGANMSGKSTFLRTVAVNMVLAMTGAPVCARKLRMSPVNIFTSMRTTDSLSKNESYFYAELKRLKILSERLEAGENVFFILDEILKGTNSTDKSQGSRMYLRKLIGLGATGLIATHDISLGEMAAEFPENVINKCFEINIEGESISFDYKLRDGITRRMNAVALMKQMDIV